MRTASAINARRTGGALGFLAVLVCLSLPGCGDESLPSRGDEGPQRLKLYAGAGLRPAMAELIAEFEEESGIKVVPDYGGSGIIVSRAQMDSEADLFMPGDVWYVDQLHAKSGVIESKTAVAFFVPVIIVDKDSDKKINSLADLLGEGVKLGIGNPKSCQIGRITQKIFAKNDIDTSKLDGAKQSLTVNELGVWVKTSDIDAAIVWDAIAANIADSVRIIEIPKEQNIISHVVVGLMKTSKNKDRARKFIEFMTGEKGRAILNRKGYRTEAP